MNNPFTLSFGKKPTQFISRITQTNEIVDNFNYEELISEAIKNEEISKVTNDKSTEFNNVL